MSRTIAVLITCFNRREKTLECLRRLHLQQLPENFSIEIFAVDDGSTDGTSEAIAKDYPEVRVIRGTGSLYWAGGMRLAWAQAAKISPDYFMLINDDTEIVPGATAQLIDIVGEPLNERIAVAAIADPESRKVIYGAYRNGVNGNIPSGSRVTGCSTFNANCVLLTSAVHAVLGIFDATYTHGMADHDYGYTASRAGIDIIQSEEVLGECYPNSRSGTWQDPGVPRRKRWELVNRPKGLLWREWLYYCRRNLGWKWPAYFIGPYLRIFFRK